jgi:hypothetical protein
MTRALNHPDCQMRARPQPWRAAQASTYHVRACSDDAGSVEPLTLKRNNSWFHVPAAVPSGSRPGVSPAGSLQHDGVVAHDQVPGPSDAPSGADVYLRLGWGGDYRHQGLPLPWPIGVSIMASCGRAGGRDLRYMRHRVRPSLRKIGATPASASTTHAASIRSSAATLPLRAALPGRH